MPYFHVITATHDSRTSQRMIDYKVRELRNNGLLPKAQPIWFEMEDEIFITTTIKQIVIDDNLKVYAYNICGDHFHLLLECEKSELNKIIGKIKAVSSKEYNFKKGITARGHVPLLNKKLHNKLWTQKFGCKQIETRNQLADTINYIKTNRLKHELATSSKLEELISEFCKKL